MARFAGWAVLGVGVLLGADAQIHLRPSGRPPTFVPAARPLTQPSPEWTFQPPTPDWTLHPPRPEWTFKPPCEPTTCSLRGFVLATDGYVYGTSLHSREESSDLCDFYLHRVSSDGREQWNVSRFTGNFGSDVDWVLASGGMSVITTRDPWAGGTVNYEAVDAGGKFRWGKNWSQIVLSQWAEPLVCPGGDLYIPTWDMNGVGVVSATSGQVMNVSRFGARLSSAPRLYCGPDDTVFIYARVDHTVTTSKLLIRAHANLTEMWRADLGQNTSSLDLLTTGQDGTFYGIAADDMTIFALDVSGKFRWTHKWTHPLPDILLVGTNGTLYVVSGMLVAFLGQDGELLWSRSEGVRITAPIIQSDGGVLYQLLQCAPGGPCNATAKAVSPEGQITWEHSFDDDRRFVAGGDNSVYSFNRKVLSRFTNDGTLQWNFTDGTFVESVSVDKGFVYVTTTSQVYAFRDSPTLVSNWV